METFKTNWFPKLTHNINEQEIVAEKQSSPTSKLHGDFRGNGKTGKV